MPLAHLPVARYDEARETTTSVWPFEKEIVRQLQALVACVYRGGRGLSKFSGGEHVDLNEGEAAFAADIHQRLLAGDPVATSDLCRHYLDKLFRQLRSKWPYIDEDLVYQAVTDAMLDFGPRADRFDPTRSSLNGYLLMIAHRDLTNKYRQEAHHRDNIVSLRPVENDDGPGNTEVGRTEDFAEGVLDDMSAAELNAGALALCETEEERIVARLMLQQERQTAVFAAALGLSELPPRDQRDRVYRIKDRITRRWDRARGDLHHV